MQGMDAQEEIKAKAQLEPYLAVDREDSAIYLVTDNMIVDLVEPRDVPFALMAAFYVFSVQYPKRCHSFYSFLEVFVLKQLPDKAPASVKHLLASLQA